MIKGKKIAVVIPAFNEELLISQVIRTMPSYVDRIYIVDDCSKDKTVRIIKDHIKKLSYKNKLILLKNEINSGVGVSIVNGYYQASKDNMDVVAVMAGDAQMDPKDLKAILMPVIEDRADYSKGNRLFYDNAWKIIPKYRYIGNSILSLMTKIASGYWRLADSQTGYTAVSKRVINILPLKKIFPRYGYPNHLLVMLNVYNMRICEVPIRPVYNIGEKTGIRLYKIIPTLLYLISTLFLWRMKEKYIVRDFHPLVFFYALSFLLIVASVILGFRLIYFLIVTGLIPTINMILLTFTLIMGFQSSFFAMWFDMEYNDELNIRDNQ